MNAFFAVLLIVAALIGRHSTVESTGLALIWPAAGVTFLWGLWASRRPAGRWVPFVAIVPLQTAVNLITGLAPVLSVATAIAGLVQMVVAVVLFRRAVPAGTLCVVSDYLRLGVVALGACAAGGLVTAAGSALAGGADPLAVAIPYLVRHAVSLAAIGALGIVIGTGIMARAHGEARPTQTLASRTEFLLLCLVTAGLYVFVFGAGSAMPLAYVTIPAHMWAGLRLRAGWAMLHGLVCGGFLVVFTLLGRGPFQDLGPGSAAYVAQTFMFIAFSLAAVLSLSMDERRRLIARLYRATAEAAAAADLRNLVIGKMNDGVIVSGPDRRLLFQNAASERWLGGGTARPGEVWRRDYEVFTADGTPLEDSENPLYRALDGEGSERVELDLKHRSGEVVHLSVDSVALPEEQGALVVMRNVTSERVHQRDLSRFASVVAHDLLTPLTVFDGWLEMLEDPNLSESERLASIERLQQASLRMRTLIRNLLAYSLAKEERLTATRIDVAVVAGGIVDHRTALPGTQLPDAAFVIDAPVPLFADERLFLQLLENLIGNALKYGRTDGTGEVRVTTSSDSVSGRTVLRVSDNGIGVPEGDVEKVFEEFHRSENGLRQASGTGLGLAICRRIVESHGGSIVVRNLPEGGAEFTVSLPGSPGQLPEGVPLVGEDVERENLSGDDAGRTAGVDAELDRAVDKAVETEVAVEAGTRLTNEPATAPEGTRTDPAKLPARS